MPKLKTHKGITKRVRVTAGGKVLRSRAGRRHLMSRKNRKRSRHLRKKLTMFPADGKKFLILLGKKV